ncbi:MAG: hypothetical protein M0R74_07865 [Dehalococcoidia bacterium]|nr:hypothetical protein [Dehalococcoidia bacterium]
MERVRIRPLAIAAAVGALLLAAFVLSTDADASGRQVSLVPQKLPYTKVMPALLPNSKENTSVIAQNDGNTAATIALDVYTPAGVLIPQASKVEAGVPAGGTRTFAQAYNGGLTPGFRGVGVLSSDQPLNALLVRDIEDAGTRKKSYSVHNAYATGANKVSLPYLSNQLNGIYNTRFAIANTGSSTACVTVQYAYVGGGGFTDNGPGGGGCASGYPVPVNGQIAFGPHSVPAEGTTAMPAATVGKFMAATVTSTGSPVTVAVDAYLQSGLRKLASYDGFVVGEGDVATDDIGKVISIPLAIKTGGYYSQILLSNPNNVAVTATIVYRDGTSGQTYTVTRQVPANGTANSSVYDADSPVPEGFVGAATVTANQPIAAVLFRSKMTGPGTFVDQDLYTAVSGVPVDRATNTVKLPLIFRHMYKAGAAYGYNTWVSVAVADGGTANLTLTTVTDTSSTPASCGAAPQYTTTKTITGSFVFYQIQNTDNGLGANPNCLWGGMTITSDKPIIAISNSTNDLRQGDNDGLYNAFAR